MIFALPLGQSASIQHIVANEHLALVWHSGAAAVLSTPQMIGWMETAAVAAVDPLLPEGYHTVGSAVDIRHLAPSVEGAKVTVRATLMVIEERLLTFHVEAADEKGIIGQGQHQRYIIHLERFEAKARARAV